MLRWIAILGGVLLMMGQHSRSESLFYYSMFQELTSLVRHTRKCFEISFTSQAGIKLINF